jgi:hypothetical protein
MRGQKLYTTPLSGGASGGNATKSASVFEVEPTPTKICPDFALLIALCSVK